MTSQGPMGLEGFEPPISCAGRNRCVWPLSYSPFPLSEEKGGHRKESSEHVNAVSPYFCLGLRIAKN